MSTSTPRPGAEASRLGFLAFERTPGDADDGEAVAIITSRLGFFRWAIGGHSPRCDREEVRDFVHRHGGLPPLPFAVQAEVASWGYQTFRPVLVDSRHLVSAALLLQSS